MKNLLILGATAYISISSCVTNASNENLEFNTQLENKALLQKPDLKPISTNDYLINDGRLKFSSKEDLKNKIEKIKQLPLEDIEATFRPIYEQGFRSMKPFYNEEDTMLLDEYEQDDTIFEAKQAAFKSYSNARSDVIEEEVDDDDELIGDEHFAALLNMEREIQVGDKVYKFTEQGLYSATPDKMPELNERIKLDRAKVQLSQAKLSSSMSAYKSMQGYSLSTADYDLDRCPPELAVYGEEHLSPGVSKHVIKRCDFGGGGGGSSSGGSTSGGSTSSSSGSSYYDQLADNYLNNRQYCNPDNATIPWFGTKKKCITKFGRRDRVKTVFWNQNYVIYRSIGVKVKNQKRRFRIWWAKKSDELRLGISQAYFEFDLEAPDYYSLATELYLHNGNAYDSRGVLLNGIPGASVPEFPFNTNNFDTVHIVVKLPVFGVVNSNLTPEKVDQMLWNGLWNKAKNIAKQNGNELLQSSLLIGYTEDKVVVSYMDKSFRKTNKRNIVKVFDWQAQAGVVFGVNQGGGLSFKTVQIPSLYDYENVKIDIYGLSRHGSTWKGDKLKYEDN